MLDTHSITIDPLGPAEAEALRRLARAERGFAAVARHASRLTFLSAASGGRLDPEAAVGLRLSEADAVLALARTPARTKAERDWKAGVVRSWKEGGGTCPVVDAMLQAALEADRANAVCLGPRTRAGRERS